MLRKISSQIDRFRIIAFAEGSSFLLLVLFAVPFKYIFDMPGFSNTDPIHGFLFVLYVIQAIQLKIGKDWPLRDLAVLLVAALIPFETFYFVPRIIRKHDAL